MLVAILSCKLSPIARSKPSNGAAFQGSPVNSHPLVAATILATFMEIAQIHATDMADLFRFPNCPNGPHAHPDE